MENHKVWMKAASAVLAVAMGACLGVPAIGVTALQTAWADADYGTGTVKIVKNEGNGDVSYDGYQIFMAKVSAQDSRTATDIIWKDAARGEAVSEALAEWGSAHGTEYAGKTAQDAAEYISANLNAGGTGSSVRADSDSFALAIAKKLASADEGSSADKTGIAPGTSAELDEGYWLFVTSSASTAADGAEGVSGTAPIFYAAVSGSETLEINEKTSVPRIVKTVVEDSGVANQANTAADAFIGQELVYRLTGTVADNIGSYDSYTYEFVDQLDDGLEVVDTSGTNDGWSVCAYDGPINEASAILIKPSCYTVSYESHQLKISFDDLKSIEPALSTDTITVSKKTRIVVTYHAKLSADAEAGHAYANNAKLVYSNNPSSGGTGTSTAQGTKTYTYALDLEKVDRNTEKPLAGAKFTLRFKGSDGSGSQYVVATGENGVYQVTGTTENDETSTTEDRATEFESGESGSIKVVGLNAGTYEVVETYAPQGYNKAAKFTFKIAPTYGEDGTLAALTNTVDAAGYAIAGVPDGDTTDNALSAQEDGAGSSDLNTGSVTVTVGDSKNVTLPLTGMSGVTLTWVAGGAVLLLTIGYGAHVARSRRREQS